jgi:hypothetical protein
MTRVGRVGANITLEITAPEAEFLSALIVEYLGLLSPTATDAILNRLFPAAYGEDIDASQEFAGRTRDRVRARKADTAELVGAAVRLEPPLELGPPVVDRWLALLTDLRLLVAHRLDLHEDDDPIPETDLGILYQWLGLLQETLLSALTAES